MYRSLSTHFKNINLVIFDLDGTLVDTAPDIVEAVKYTLDYFKCERKSDDEIISYIGGGARKVLQRAMGEKAQEHLEEALVLFKSFYTENCAVKSSLYPNAKDLLDDLKDHGRMISLCTLKTRDATYNILRTLKIEDYFKMVVTSDDIQHPKPDPQGFQIILDELKVMNTNAVIIGDTDTDILAGKNACMKTIGVTFGYGSEQSIRDSDPDIIVSDLEQLVK